VKVNKCNCPRDDKRVIESKADIARTLKEAGMPADVLAITSVGFAGNDPDFPVIYLINKNGKEFTAAIQREPLKELCRTILEELEKADDEDAKQIIQ
jgi:hypothetical protein